jgi:hypothetical protein
VVGKDKRLYGMIRHKKEGKELLSVKTVFLDHRRLQILASQCEEYINFDPLGTFGQQPLEHSIFEIKNKLPSRGSAASGAPLCRQLLRRSYSINRGVKKWRQAALYERG